MDLKTQLLKSILFFFLLTAIVFAQGEMKKDMAKNVQTDKDYVSFTKEEGDFILSNAGKSTALLVSSSDYPGVIRAVKDLQSDIAAVTNARPDLSIDEARGSKEFVIVGTLGKSKLIDQLAAQKKIDVENLYSKWETFLIETVDNPFPGVDKATVIVGSDKRGTIYGIYDLSEKIGVSPWYWWADVPVKKHTELFIKNGQFSNGEPAVKYRGIFLNDEAPALTGWAHEKFGGLNHKFYEKVFELILRLKGNYLWPAMWGNNFDDDDSLNQKLADEYGIVMGTSHHEPMMRSWKEWPKYGHGAWNYQTNDSTLREYWRGGIKRMNSYESIVTLGMRGDGDEAMSASANTSLLEKIVADQRKILGEVTGKDVTTIPQVWALYKEVQEYYDEGMRVPDDVTLLLCDDNWGNLRRLPLLTSKPRKGGYGIYYHFDYVGGPRNYKWLNTVQIERVWEQMHLAYEYGARQIWIVNVGDLKPLEFPISFFLDYAWNPNKYSAKDIPGYYVNWAKEQFGEKYAEDIAGILALYTKYNSRRKPELLSPGTYSLVNYREAQKVVTDYNNLVDRAKKIYDMLPSEYKSAFYQLVLYPVEACANLNELYVTAGLNHLYAEHGRASANNLAGKVKTLFDKDTELSNYYNKIMANSKWNHMMDQIHIGYTSWQQPDVNIVPNVKDVNLHEETEMGIAIEGSPDWWPHTKSKAVLPEFDSFNKQVHYVDIFNRGKKPFDFTIKTSEPWILTNSPEDNVNEETRLLVSIDWKKAPAGKHSAIIKITGAQDSTVTVNVVMNNLQNELPHNYTGFVESNGYVSMEAEHYTKAFDGNSISWLTIPNLGRTLSAVTAVPVTAPSQIPASGTPHLDYDVYLTGSGEVNVKLFFSPTLNFLNSPNGIRFGISFDDETPQIMNMTSNTNPPDLNRDRLWNKWVADNINIQVSKYKIDKPGKHVLKFWFVDPGAVLQKIVIDCDGERPSYLGPPESFRNSYEH